MIAWAAAASTILLYDLSVRSEQPLVIHSLRLLTPVVSPGGSVEYETVYTKQAACYPPRGSGEVRYSFERAGQTEGARGALIAYGSGSRRADWTPGNRLIGAGAAQVPDDLPLGDYIVVGTATYQCDTSPGVARHVRTAPMRVRVIPKP